MSSSDLHPPPGLDLCSVSSTTTEQQRRVCHPLSWILMARETPFIGRIPAAEKSLFVNYSIKFSTLFAPTQSSYHPQLLMFCVWRFIQQMIIIRLMDQRISEGVTPSSSDTGDKWRMLVGRFLLLLCSPPRTIHGRNCFRNGTNLPKNVLLKQLVHPQESPSAASGGKSVWRE